MSMTVSFLGPFSWTNVLLAREASESGIYLWTVPTQRGNEIYYVGETGRSFSERLRQHTSAFNDARHDIYAAPELTQGRRRLLWPGFGADKDECREQSKHLTSHIREMMSVMRLFLAPLGTDTDTRKRIEAAVIDSLYDTPVRS
jgi:hypothetical protein